MTTVSARGVAGTPARGSVATPPSSRSSQVRPRVTLTKPGGDTETPASLSVRSFTSSAAAMAFAISSGGFFSGFARRSAASAW
jgi:hypothetical protein